VSNFAEHADLKFPTKGSNQDYTYTYVPKNNVNQSQSTKN